MLRTVLEEVNVCFMAFTLDCEVTVLDSIMHVLQVFGMDRKQFAEKVSDCNRTVAFIRFIRDGVVADISFHKGKEIVDTVAIMFDGETNKFCGI